MRPAGARLRYTLGWPSGPPPPSHAAIISSISIVSNGVIATDSARAKSLSLSKNPLPGLVPGIHVFLLRHCRTEKDMGGRVKPGHGVYVVTAVPPAAIGFR